MSEYIITRKIQIFPIGDVEEINRVHQYIRDGMYCQNRAYNKLITTIYSAVSNGEEIQVINEIYKRGQRKPKDDESYRYIFFIRKTFKPFNHMFKTNAEGRLLQCRFIPRGGDYIMEIVYEIEVSEPKCEVKQVASIDLGVENFVTMVNNIGIPPIIVKGGVLKSINQYYNKRKATMQSELKRANSKDWSKALQRLTNKRFEKIKYHMHCISKQIVDWCANNDIDTLIVGHNTTWKQGASYMQNFTYIPYDMFIRMLKYKCENVSIVCIEVDEAYTSGTSFIDDELPVKENYNMDRRIHRGLFKADCGRKINADVNGAYQIIKKVVPNIFVDGIEGVRFTPIVA